MNLSTVQTIKSTIVSATGLPRDALHVYAGLTILIFSAVVCRRTLGSIAPWLVVFFLTLIVEFIDMRNDIVNLGYWRWSASLKDIVNTLFWPTVLLLYTRFGGTLRKV